MPAGAVDITLHFRLRLIGAVGGPRVGPTPFGPEFNRTFDRRISEADQFYANHIRHRCPTPREARGSARPTAACSGFPKQFYCYVVENGWQRAIPSSRSRPAGRKGRNGRLEARLTPDDVLSMPDKWEYPWFAAWDLAFPPGDVRPRRPAVWPSRRLLLMLREWYMHPNGQLPAYEFAFGDVNPPVHAWACWRIYKMTGERGQSRYAEFLERDVPEAADELHLVGEPQRPRPAGTCFSGGFLGLDNIGVFDRNAAAAHGRASWNSPTAPRGWLSSAVTMLSMAIELARGRTPRMRTSPASSSSTTSRSSRR